MSLTDTAIRQAKPGTKPVKFSDEKGLYLLIQPNGSKLWRWKYRYLGKEKLMPLGAYPETTLAQARKAHVEGRLLLNQGTDPMEQRKAAKHTLKAAADQSFQAVSLLWWEHWSNGKSPRHVEYVKRRMEADIFPALGSRPIANITALQLLSVAKRIESRGAVDIAKRSLQTCNQIMRYAVAHGIIERNPGADVRPSDALKPRKKENYARLEAKELPELLRKIEAYQGTAYTRLAMKLMALTFVRTSELIGARWEEFDLIAAEWRIPAARMKMRTPHIVPLAPQAVEVLQVLQTLSGSRDLLFPGERDQRRPMSNNTILAALKRMGYAGRMTGHGFRGIASTLLHEQGHPHHLIELQLAHQERDETSGAYNHAMYLIDRRNMMNIWADYLDKLRKGADVIPLHTKAT